jgi:hypothetical protein
LTPTIIGVIKWTINGETINGRRTQYLQKDNAM